MGALKESDPATTTNVSRADICLLPQILGIGLGAGGYLLEHSSCRSVSRRALAAHDRRLEAFAKKERAREGPLRKEVLYKSSSEGFCMQWHWPFNRRD